MWLCCKRIFLESPGTIQHCEMNKQVKPGFTNYLPRGLAQKIESFLPKLLKIFKKHLQNYSKMSKISEKCGEILTDEKKKFKNILTG